MKRVGEYVKTCSKLKTIIEKCNWSCSNTFTINFDQLVTIIVVFMHDLVHYNED